jgi:hypothetical protein
LSQNIEIKQPVAEGMFKGRERLLPKESCIRKTAAQTEPLTLSVDVGTTNQS